jgi:hypothetical protein
MQHVENRCSPTPPQPRPFFSFPKLLLNSHSCRAGKDPELGPDSSYPPWVFDLAQPAPSRQVLLQRCQRSALHHVLLTSPHLTSPHLTSPHLTSPHLTSPHLTSPHLVPGAVQGNRLLHIHAASISGARAQCFSRPRPPRLLPPAQFLRLERRADIKLSNSATSKK